MTEFTDIFWHDCVIDSVIELPDKDQLALNVQYPSDWENNVFEPKCIIFEDYYSQEVNEIPFSGSPTILNAEVVSDITSPLGVGGYIKVKLETNAGERFITARGIRLESNHVST